MQVLCPVFNCIVCVSVVELSEFFIYSTLDTYQKYNFQTSSPFIDCLFTFMTGSFDLQKF